MVRLLSTCRSLPGAVVCCEASFGKLKRYCEDNIVDNEELKEMTMDKANWHSDLVLDYQAIPPETGADGTAVGPGGVFFVRSTIHLLLNLARAREVRLSDRLVDCLIHD